MNPLLNRLAYNLEEAERKNNVIYVLTEKEKSLELSYINFPAEVKPNVIGEFDSLQDLNNFFAGKTSSYQSYK